MNVLPLVFSFLIVFSLLVPSVLRNTLSTRYIKQALFALDEAEQSIRQEQTKDLFNKIPTHKIRKSHPDLERKSERRRFNSRRNKLAEFPRQKFNLYPVIKEAKEKPAFFKACCKALDYFYKESLFSKNNITSQEILNQLITLAKKNPHATSLEELVASKSPVHDVLYLMFKGTHNFITTSKNGYPPFTDFFTWNKDLTMPLQYSYCTKTLLEAVLGYETTKQILDEETNRYYQRKEPYYSKEILDHILSARFQGEAVQNLTSIFSYSQYIPKNGVKRYYSKAGKMGVKTSQVLPTPLEEDDDESTENTSVLNEKTF